MGAGKSISPRLRTHHFTLMVCLWSEEGGVAGSFVGRGRQLDSDLAAFSRVKGAALSPGHGGTKLGCSRTQVQGSP